MTNEQFDTLMRVYDEKRQKAWMDAEERLEKIREEIPAYRDLEDEIASTAGSVFRGLGKRSFPDPSFPDTSAAQEKIRLLSEKKRALLKEAGYPEDYAEPVFECPDCQDTGFLPDRSKCACFKKRERELLYSQSHLSNILETNNFDCLSYEYLEGEDLESFKKTVQVCHTFADSFSKDYAKKEFENLLFYGNVGTGKSFLSCCIAKQLLDQGFSVIYFSADALFSLLSDAMFRKGDENDLRSVRSELYECDLIIIDDLGTELMSSAVALHLFSMLNERYLNRKSVIISTNMSLAELQERYADRIFSRIIERYKFLKLTGPDIRRMRRVKA